MTTIYSKFEQCSKCGEFAWNTAHTCKQFEVRIPDVDYDKTVWAIDEQYAAQSVVEWYDSQDYHIWAGRGEYVDVLVREYLAYEEYHGDGENTECLVEWNKYVVSCEVEPSYYARKAER